MAQATNISIKQIIDLLSKMSIKYDMCNVKVNLDKNNVEFTGVEQIPNYLFPPIEEPLDLRDVNPEELI